MNQQSKTQAFFNQRQLTDEASGQFNSLSYFNSFKEESFCPISTQLYSHYYQPFMQNLPTYSHGYNYPPIQSGYSISPFPYFSLQYPYQSNLRNYYNEFQKPPCNTQAQNDDDGRKQESKPKKQQPEMEKSYGIVKQQIKIEQTEGVKNQINVNENICGNSQISKKNNGASQTGEIITRKDRVIRYRIKKQKRRFQKRIVYQCRKSVADNRQRFKGRFVKRTCTDEQYQKQLHKKEQNILV